MRRLIWLAALLPVLGLAQTTVQVAPSDSLQSGCALAANNATCTVPLAGKSTARFLITGTSTPSGMTLVAESSADGTNWTQRLFIDTESGNTLWSIPNATLATGYTRTLGMGGGDRFMRVRVSAYTSGSITVLVSATDTVQRPDLGIVRIRPVDPQALGSYSLMSTSGTIAAGMAAGATVYSFRWTSSTSVAVIRRVYVGAVDVTTGFVAGQIKFVLFRATSFSANDTAGTAATITSPNGKLDTGFAATGVGQIMIANTGAMTAGTRTLDTMPQGFILVPANTTANAVQLSNTDFWPPRQNPVQYPLVLRQNEGIVIQGTVPGTGTWQLIVCVEWDELAAFP